MELLGRRQIFCDEQVIDESNILRVLDKAFTIHEKNRAEILYLSEYAKGKQPILKRKKQIRPEINEKIVDNMAAEILEFKLGYEFGSPITYVQRARNDIKSRRSLKSFLTGILTGRTQKESQAEDMRVASLNEMMVEECKAAKDLQLAKDVKTDGVGYRLVYPKKIKTGVSVFDLLVLNPENTFVVYSNDAYREPMLGVTYFQQDTGGTIFGCYTKSSYFEIVRGVIYDPMGRYTRDVPAPGQISVKTANVLGMVPIIEYINDYDRMGCFERVIPLIDALNTIDSDRVNDIAQHVQNLLWGDNIDIDREQYAKLREDGIIVTSSEQGRQATLKYLESVLNQSENQTLVDYVKQQILDITNTPSRSELSGGSTGSATNMSTGWMAAETDAKEKEQIWGASERRETAVVLRILQTSDEVDADMAKLSLSDIEIRFSRSKTYDLATKTNSLATLINTGIDPLRAIETVGLFTDPQQVTLDSAERIDRILFKIDEQDNTAQDSSDQSGDAGKQQPDITDQPSTKSVSDE